MIKRADIETREIERKPSRHVSFVTLRFSLEWIEFGVPRTPDDWDAARRQCASGTSLVEETDE